MEEGNLVEDCELGRLGILIYRDDFYPNLWHVYYEDGHLSVAFENALAVISESR